jgi:D-amino-acid dehydrogenase
MHSSSFDLIVIGGGIVGTSAAYHAVRDGASVLLIDRNDPGRATNAGAGILAPEMNKRDPDAWFNFAVEAVGYYPALTARLEAENAGETSYARCGMLLVAATEDELSDFDEAESYIFGRQRQRGTPAADALHKVDAAEAKALFPPLCEVLGAIYYRDACRVDGRLMTAAMLRAAQAKGLTQRAESVQALEIHGGHVTGVKLGGETIAAGAVIIAGGAWSAAFAEQLGVTIGVEPQRGQIAHWDVSPAPAEAWPIVGAFHGHYMLTFPGGRVVTGATRETNSGYAPHSSAAGMREVIDEALRVAPGLANARLLELRVGLRPFTRDGLPVLGAVPAVAGVVLATGHGATGLQLGPYSGKLAAELALGRKVATDLSAFTVTRFAVGQ